MHPFSQQQSAGTRTDTEHIEVTAGDDTGKYEQKENPNF